MKSFCPPLTRLGSVAALLTLFTSLLGGCDGGQSGAEVATGGSDGNVPPSPGGALECEVDEECRDSALAELEVFSEPRPTQYEISGSSCQASGVLLEDRQVSGPACTCNFAGGGSRMLGPSGIGCSVLGRSGECLWSDAEFSGCSITDPHACDAQCAELAERLTADSQRSFQTELVYAGCEQGKCRNVVSIDGQC